MKEEQKFPDCLDALTTGVLMNLCNLRKDTQKEI